MCTRVQSQQAVDVFLESVLEAVRTGKSVGLAGLGTLSIRETAARTGVRPGTSERIQIPAGKKVAFKVATTLQGTLSATFCFIESEVLRNLHSQRIPGYHAQHQRRPSGRLLLAVMNTPIIHEAIGIFRNSKDHYHLEGTLQVRTELGVPAETTWNDLVPGR
ncbi:HU family DNA-binding protein [Deinococcus deserti]